MGGGEETSERRMLGIGWMDSGWMETGWMKGRRVERQRRRVDRGEEEWSDDWIEGWKNGRKSRQEEGRHNLLV